MATYVSYALTLTIASNLADPSVGGEAVDLRPLYAELAGTLRVVVYNGDIDGQ
eukprot:COSAG06_NODE_44917_length_359_cov_0.796154_1_plen_52_part_01